MRKILFSISIFAIMISLLSLGCSKRHPVQPVVTNTPDIVATDTPIFPTNTWTSTLLLTATPTNTATKTNTIFANTSTNTPIIPTNTHTLSSTPSSTRTLTQTSTYTNTRTNTQTFTLTRTATVTPTYTVTRTPTNTPIATAFVQYGYLYDESHLAIDNVNSELYYTTIYSSNYGLCKISISGGAAQIVVNYSGGSIVLDNFNVYVARGDIAANRILVRYPITGGSYTGLTTCMTSCSVLHLTQDDTSIYFLYGDELQKRLKGGGGSASLATIANYTTIRDAVMAGAYIFLSNSNNGTITRVQYFGAGSGLEESVITGLNNPWGLASDGAIVFYADMGNGRIQRCNTDGSNQTTIASGLISPKYLWYDSATMYVYFSDPGAGVIGKVLSSGGPITIIRTGLSNPGNLITDDTYVYWIDISEDIIWRYSK